MGMAERMLSSTGAASLPCLHGSTIRGPEEPWGSSLLEKGQESRHFPAGPGHAPHSSHPARRGALTASPGRDGIPSEGRDARPAGSLTHPAATALYQLVQ